MDLLGWLLLWILRAAGFQARPLEVALEVRSSGATKAARWAAGAVKRAVSR